MYKLLYAAIAPIMWAIGGTALGKSKSSISYPIAIGIASVLLIIFALMMQVYGTSKITLGKSDFKPLIIAGIAYCVGGYIFNQLVSGKPDANYWVAITAAMLPVFSLVAAHLTGENILTSQWVGLCVCIFGILLMGKVIKF